MKRVLFLSSLIISIIVGSASLSLAGGEIDVLVNKLVEKGILTPLEAQVILDETKVEVSKSISEQDHSTLPSWIQKIKLSGDFRLRHQYERKANELQSRNRGRIRYRLGIDAKIFNNLKVGAGLASGGDDPRSTNQTFDDSFDTGDIRLDYAYAEYMPTRWSSVIGGKFKRKDYLWAPTDLLWDGDINPEGGSLALFNTFDFEPELDWFINSGIWVVEELNSDNDSVIQESGLEDDVDPFMTYVQGGLKWADENLDVKAAAIYYGFNGFQGVDFPWSKDTNTKFGGSPGFLVYDYDSYGFSAEFGMKEPLNITFFERVAVFGDYINNVDPEADHAGWAAGLKFGNKKIKEPGQWQCKYTYSWLQKDAWPDIFPDSDRYGGSTDVKGHEAAFSYGLMNNVTLGFDYYNTDKIVGTSQKEHLAQTDILIKF